MEDKKSLLKKLHALAERGEAGEREAAEAALERLTKKYSITIDELDTEEVKVFEFEFHGDDEKQLLIQIAWKVTNSLGNCSQKSNQLFVVHCTESQYIEIEFLFDFYRRVWKQEREMLLRAFVDKHGIYAKDVWYDRVSNIKKMRAMADCLSYETPVRQITSSPVGIK